MAGPPFSQRWKAGQGLDFCSRLGPPRVYEREDKIVGAEAAVVLRAVAYVKVVRAHLWKSQN